MQENRKVINQSQAVAFMLGGNALFTFRNIESDTRFTFKVLQNHKNENLYDVSVLVGPDNTSNYRKFGTITIDENGMPFFRSLGSHASDKLYCKWFDRIFLDLCIGITFPKLEIWHCGRCCKCGRLLTVPRSVDMGIGPECENKVNLSKYSNA